MAFTLVWASGRCVKSLRATCGQTGYNEWVGMPLDVLVGVRAMRCTACGSELILTNVVPDGTVAVRGVEHHTFICCGCHVSERRVVFIKDGRETDGPPMPMQAAQRIKRGSTVQDEHVAAPGFLSRVLALVRGP